jgi:hypothetical protein
MKHCVTNGGNIPFCIKKIMLNKQLLGRQRISSVIFCSEMARTSGLHWTSVSVWRRPLLRSFCYFWTACFAWSTSDCYLVMPFQLYIESKDSFDSFSKCSIVCHCPSLLLFRIPRMSLSQGHMWPLFLYHILWVLTFTYPHPLLSRSNLLVASNSRNHYR